MQIMGGDGEGGLEKHVVDLSNEMSKHADVIVVAHEKYQDRFDQHVEFVALDLSKSRRNPWVLFKLYRLIKQYSPDVVHAQANKAGLMVAAIRKFIPSKSVVTIHNEKKNLKFLHSFDLAIGVSKGVASQFPKGLKAQVVYNGIAVPELKNNISLVNEIFGDESKLNVLAVGRLVPAKGFDVLLQAWQHVDANLVIAGDGPDHGALREMLDGSPELSKKVQLLGHRDDVPELIGGADFLVISSRKEGFSYVFNEALLLAKPVVSTDVPVPNEVLPSEYLCDTEDAEALALLINSAVDNVDELKEAFKPLFLYANENFTVQNMAANTLNAYASL
jgi:glycosyltransferase involved in cell wall biosynthesis